MHLARPAPALLAAALAAAVSAAPPPPAAALRLDRPPALDGRLDEPFWQAAPALGAFVIHDKTAAGKPASDTEVRLAYDNAWLYLGVRCRNPLQALVLDPKVTAHDGPVNTDESVEVFLSSDPQGRAYYHFLLSCFNVRAEQRFLNGVRERETWNLPWRSATARTDDGWTAELAIPLTLLLEHGDLEHVRLNIARNRRAPFKDANGVITHDVFECSLWRPVVNTFHEPESFGALAPLRPKALAVPFLVALERVEIRPYVLSHNAMCYGVEAVLKGASPASGAVDLAVADRPVSGPGTTVCARAVVQGTETRTVSLAVPVAAPADRTVAVELRDAAGGEVLQALTLETPAALNVFRAWLDRNYYTAEPDGAALAEIGLPADSLNGMRVTVTAGEMPLGTAPAAPHTRVALALDALPVGTHPVRIALIRADGAPFAAATADLVKRAPRPGREVKVDQVNRVLLKDGAPLFPFGPVLYSIPPDNEAVFRDVAAAGCNTLFQWFKDLPAEDAARYAVAAQAHGLHLVALLETGWQPLRRPDLDALPPAVRQTLGDSDLQQLAAMERGGDLALRGLLMQPAFRRLPGPVRAALFDWYCRRNHPQSERAVRGLMASPALLAYNSFDEPYDSRVLDMRAPLEAIYRLAHQTDGYHPVMLNYSSYIPDGDAYVTPCDILVTDPYWVPGGDAAWGVRRTPNFVSKITAWTDRRAAAFRKATWIIPLGWRWSNCRRRGISGPEQDCQNFLALIHGARGLFWFCYPLPDPAWDNLKASIRKLQVVGPMAVQPQVGQVVSYQAAAGPGAAFQPAAFDPDKDAYPDVQGRLFRDPADGGLVLLAANSQYFPVPAAFTVAGLTNPVGRLFADAVLPVRGQAFADALEPFAVRAYRLGRLAEPVSLTIATRRPAAVPPPDFGWPNNARTGKKNVFPNPSFEEATIPGSPDYYFASGQRQNPSTELTLVEDPGAARFGKRCLRLAREAGTHYACVQWACGPRFDQDTACAWSFWARGAAGGERIWARAAEDGALKPPDPATFTLTKDWQRYHLPVTVPARANPLMFELRLWAHGQDFDTAWQAWLDGVQLETGLDPTNFDE